MVYSMFDIIGPNMIGPSSSHTAGALKIALLAYKMMKHPIKKVKFILYGSFARTYQGHGTDRALLSGILGFREDDARIRDSFEWAKKTKIEYEFQINTDRNDFHPNTVEIFVWDEQEKKMVIRGESIGGGAARIVQINQVDVALTGDYPTLLIQQKDEPGVLAYITQCLNKFHINIATVKLYRENKGKMAYTIIETDEKIPEDALILLEQCSQIATVQFLTVS
ncbi:L-serine dehydratase, iron-sulfur-dependent subunit beta [Clostridia bacterium]|nr:L-serine dehydratase, iron-sulfur-dependent subunit beta [Clostridia bacterium]